ncbi:hypothetical protein [Kribbella sp. CA-294648]|uniref:hypothetical protein n=1 Tax=Kribbella sp. CA-294648 TaxID=3239948 RepID=UPI003D8B9513
MNPEPVIQSTLAPRRTGIPPTLEWRRFPVSRHCHLYEDEPEPERVVGEDLIYQALHAALFAASWTLSWGES